MLLIGGSLDGGDEDGEAFELELSRLQNEVRKVGQALDRIEAEMGDLLEGEEPFVMGAKGQKRHRKPKPRVDETLYDL